MADFSSLKQTIQSYIKQNGNEEITGNILQDVLLAMVSMMGDSAINSLASALQDEIADRQNQDGILQGNITAETTARRDADTALGGRIDGLQTAINGINTKLAEGYIYAGIATPSTNPETPSGKVFYIAVSSGTYTNFSNLTVAQGINILKYNGSAWSKDVVYAIDPRPKKNSQNLVTSGGVFDNMGALDVSELNATENPHTLAQYADLSAALAAIPTDYQKGGMSIKFVQSSDNNPYFVNKYVQYRLMSDTFNTNVANWQGVDDVLQVQEYQVKRLNNPTRKIKAPINLPLIYGEIYQAGSIQKRTDGMRYEEIIVSPTANYYYTGTSRVNGVAMVCYYDKNSTLIGTAIVGTGSNVSHTEEELTLPAGTFKMRVGSFIVSGYNELLITVEDYASRFVEMYGTSDLWAKNYIDVPLTFETLGKNLQVDGTMSTFSSGYTSTLITLDKTKKYKLHTNVDQYNCGAAFYSDSAGTTCVGFQVTSHVNKNIDEVLDIPSNAVTMRVATRDNANSINLYEIEYEEAAPLSKVEQLKEDVDNIDVSSYLPKDQGSSNYGKVMVVGADGMLVPGTGGGEDPTANSIVLHQSKTLYLGADIIDNPAVILGTGWSGSLANGLTHTSGNTGIVEIQQATVSGKKYLVECTLSSAAEASISLSIGDSPLVDVYNGGTTVKIGFISDGGYLKITPASVFSGSVSNIHIKEVVSQESAVETLNIDVGNIEDGTMTDNITGFWNVALGYYNTMGKLQNGSRNIVAGYAAMGSFVSGTRNVMLGTFAGANLVSGDRNVAIGADSFYFIKKGNDNISIGKAAMGRMLEMEANRNVAIGGYAMGNLTPDASDNIALGYQALYYGNKDNIGIGYSAGYWTKGTGNVYIGYRANGWAFLTGDNNIAIGRYAQCGVVGTSESPGEVNNSIAIGYQANATKSNQVVIGNSSHTEFVLGNKKLKFNNDNTVTWETIS